MKALFNKKGLFNMKALFNLKALFTQHMSLLVAFRLRGAPFQLACQPSKLDLLSYKTRTAPTSTLKSIYCEVIPTMVDLASVGDINSNSTPGKHRTQTHTQTLSY
jgi:hypothetical protein